MPYGTIVTIPSYFHDLTQFILPISMSMNSFDTDQNKDLVHIIEWINENTTGNFVVIGSIHWRGWFSLFLDQSNDFKFEENTIDISKLKNNSLFLTSKPQLCNIDMSMPDSKFSPIILVSDSNNLSKSLSKFQIFGSGHFNVYNISKLICKY